jgi:hypothetical protein
MSQRSAQNSLITSVPVSLLDATESRQASLLVMMHGIFGLGGIESCAG